jgi:hypothetical protein
MEPLSQLDVQNPDHISVITRDGKITVSVTKDGASVTMGFPIRNVFNTTPPVPLQQQPAPQMMAVKDTKIQSQYQQEAGLAYLEKLASKDQDSVEDKPLFRTTVRPGKKLVAHSGNYKLNADLVREIKLMLSDKATMGRFKSRQQAYEEIARVYNVSHHTISNIHKGTSWTQVNI